MIRVRALLSLEEMYDVVTLQESYWGEGIESVVPAHMLFSLAHHGGHVLAALDGKAMAGVLIGFLGTDAGFDGPAASNLQVISKRMVVLPEFRNQGIAYRLKLAQRDLAIKQGIDLVTWTFDPLLAANAHFNIRKLGARCPQYRQNYFGSEAKGGLVTLGTSDRLVVEWWLTERQVEDRLNDQYHRLVLNDYLQADALLVTGPSEQVGQSPPIEAVQIPEHRPTILLQIPANYREILDQDEALAQSWRLHLRAQLQFLLQAEYHIVDFLRESHEGRESGFYVLSQQGGR